MGLKLRSPFSRLRLLRRISTAYPSMIFLSRLRSSSINGINGGGMKIRSRSEENLNKLSDCMDNMDDDVSKLFMEFHQTDLCKDPDLFLLLNDYFTTSKAVSELCGSLRNCLEGAEHEECRLIDEALRDFEEEKLGHGGLLEASFRKTFRDLKSFNEFYDNPDFDCDFLGKIQICHKELMTLIVKLEKTMKKIDKKLKRVRGRRAIFVVVLLAPVIALISVSSYIAGLVGLVPMDALATFITSRWKKSTEGLKQEKTAMTSMERGTMVALTEVEKISRLVSRLETVERSIRVTAEFAVKKQSSVAVAMVGMEEKGKKLKSTLFDLDKETGRCDGLMQFGRKVAREKIVEFLSCGEKKASNS